MAFIEIPVTDSSILATYNTVANEGLFINRGTQLSPVWFFRITFDDDQYKYDPNEEVIVHKSVNGGYVQVIPKLLPLQIETRECRRAIADVLKRLTALNRVLTIYDYSFYDEADSAQGYTIREMILTEPVTPLGAVRKDDRWGGIGLGWRIQLGAIDYD
jgi:hypothetical protein